MAASKLMQPFLYHSLKRTHRNPTLSPVLLRSSPGVPIISNIETPELIQSNIGNMYLLP